ncbi:helix-hairpin-helix domain-containing protein [Pseudomonas sp. M30-35]|uniref:ComEA family DNA-binding protein n=1 Tax=Pseudomonas sp. M30-35 TaxID=1981174 RepID=UPI000B3C7D1B|nr:helix-hairpin-helix domain-containing protein [Pseudomonas sp. M30-35]ARU89131.1 competence protein ComEA [Pseudomonas sp. M30-35]
MRVYILPALLALVCTLAPFTISAAEPVATEQPAVEQVEAQATINLNTAEAAALQQGLTGVGEMKAKAIVAYRESTGAFASVDELLEVKGIGSAILEQNRSKLRVE